MRKLFPLLAVAVVLSGVSLVLAAEEEKTITGDAVCAESALKETKTCQNAVTLTEDGKEVTYYLEGAKSKAAHGAFGICQASKDAPIKVKVTGTPSKKGDKNILTVSKIEKAE